LLSIQDGAVPDLDPEAVPDLEFESIGFGEVKGGMDTSRSFGVLLPLLIKSKPPQSLLDAREAREALLREVSIAIIQKVFDCLADPGSIPTAVQIGMKELAEGLLSLRLA
jgi:hypothetical protein